MNTDNNQTNDLKITELEQNDLESVSGGTFWPNTHKKAFYHSLGISTRYNIISGDEFMFMGQPISYERAEEIVELADYVHRSINVGKKYNDVVDYSEPAFIRAFNCQLKLYYGMLWDGKPGADF